MSAIRLPARGITLGCLAILLLSGAIASLLLPASAFTQIDTWLRYIQQLGMAGLAAFLVIQVLVAVSGVLPASLVGIAAGAIYGVPAGFALAAVSTMAGALIAFGLSRSLLRPAITRMLRHRTRLQNFDLMLARDGWRFVFLLRLSPVLPFAAASYTLGLSAIGLRDYCLGSLAALPALLGYVFIGSLTGASLTAMSQGSGPLKWVLLGCGLLATVLITWRIGRLAVLTGLAPAAPLSRRE